MIIAEVKYDFVNSKWYLTGQIRSNKSRYKSKGYKLDKHSFIWSYHPRESPTLAPDCLSVWSK